VVTLVAIWPGLLGVWGDDWWAFYGFLQIYQVKWSVEGIPPAWFLCVLLSFYALVPLWAWGMRRVSGRIGFRRGVWMDLALVLALCAGSIVMRGAYFGAAGTRGTLNLTLVCTFYLFGAGMAFAVASVVLEGREDRVRLFRLARRAPLLFWVGAIGLLAMQVYALGMPKPGSPIETYQPWQASTFATIGVLSATCMLLPVVWGTERAGVPGMLLRFPGLAFLGTISYAFYIWHTSILRIVSEWDWVWREPHPWIVWGLTSLVVTIGVASVSWFAMERYLNRVSLEWRPRRGPRLRVAPAPAG
jgi:peptidoglycan/LPS O-acetylase OafA/YrhL